MALLLRPVLAVLLLLTAAFRCQEQAQTTDWRASLKTIRNGVHKIDTYLNAALDLLGGEDGLCQYKCNDGEGNPRPCEARAFRAFEGDRSRGGVRCRPDLDGVLWPWENLTIARFVPFL